MLRRVFKRLGDRARPRAQFDAPSRRTLRANLKASIFLHHWILKTRARHVFKSANVQTSSHGARKSRVSNLLASGSPMIFSCFTLQRILRPVTIEMYPRCPGMAE